MEQQPSQENSQESPTKINESKKAYVKYSGMGFTMAGSIVIGVLIGRYLDDYFDTDKQYWTAGMALFFLFVGMYSVLRDILFPPKKEK